MKLLNNKGIAALPTIVIISMIILLAGVGISASGLVENLISYGELEGKNALFAAEAGGRDAFERAVRNKDCNNGVPPLCSSYSISVGDATADVTVSGSNPKTIISIGQDGFQKAKIQVVVSYDAVTNKATQTSWKQLTD